MILMEPACLLNYSISLWICGDWGAYVSAEPSEDNSIRFHGAGVVNYSNGWQKANQEQELLPAVLSLQSHVRVLRPKTRNIRLRQTC